MNLESIVTKIKCILFGHKYFLIKRLTPWSKKIGCSRCAKQFGMNDDVKCIIEWSDELEEMYKVIGVATK